MEIIAHRGASSLAPENTTAAVDLAWNRLADGVEIDVHLSRDRRIAVIHDDNAKRTTGKNWTVALHSLEELKTLDAGGWKNREWRGEKIPALEEILAILPAEKKLIIEIKCGPEIIPVLETVLNRSGKPASQIAIAGFSLPLMREAKKTFPRNRVYWNSSFKRTLRGWLPKGEDLIRQAKDAGIDGLYLKACGAVAPALARKIKRAGLSLHVWTVDSPAAAKKLARIGVDSVTTNRPGWLRAELQKYRKK